MGCIDSFEHSGCLFDSSFIKQMGDRQADSEKGLKFTWPLVLGSFLWYFISGIDKSFLEKYTMCIPTVCIVWDCPLLHT